MALLFSSPSARAEGDEKGYLWPKLRQKGIHGLQIEATVPDALAGHVMPGQEVQLHGWIWTGCADPVNPRADLCDRRRIRGEEGGKAHWGAEVIDVAVTGGTFDPTTGKIAVSRDPGGDTFSIAVTLTKKEGDPLRQEIRLGYDWDAVRGPEPGNVASVELVSPHAEGAAIAPGAAVPVKIRATDKQGRVYEGHKPFFGLPAERYTVATEQGTWSDPDLALQTSRDRAANKAERYGLTVTYKGWAGQPLTRTWKADFAWMLGPDPRDVKEFTARWEQGGKVVGAEADGELPSLAPGASTVVHVRVVAKDGRTYDTAVAPETSSNGVIGLPRERVQVRAEQAAVDAATGVVSLSGDVSGMLGKRFKVTAQYQDRKDTLFSAVAAPDFGALLKPFISADAAVGGRGDAGGGGAVGAAGAPGQGGGPAPGPGKPGGDGANGGPGSPGKPGPAVDVWATPVTLIGSDQQWILVKWKVGGAPARFAVRAPDGGPITFTSIGGPGGAGGAGGQGGAGGGGGWNVQTCTGGDGGTGGTGGGGGNGGAGGTGGRVTLNLGADELRAHILGGSRGGDGGAGGPGGAAGDAGQAGGVNHTGAAMATAAVSVLKAINGESAPSCAYLGSLGAYGSEGSGGASGPSGRDGSVEVRVGDVGRSSFSDAPKAMLDLLVFTGGGGGG